MGDMFGSAPTQPQTQASNENGMGFGMGFGDDAFGGNNDAQDDNNDEAGWADGFGDSSSGIDKNRYHLNFARAEVAEVLNSNTPGSKQKKSGLGVSAAINFNVEKN